MQAGAQKAGEAYEGMKETVGCSFDHLRNDVVLIICANRRPPEPRRAPKESWVSDWFTAPPDREVMIAYPNPQAAQAAEAARVTVRCSFRAQHFYFSHPLLQAAQATETTSTYLAAGQQRAAEALEAAKHTAAETAEVAKERASGVVGTVRLSPVSLAGSS